MIKFNQKIDTSHTDREYFITSDLHFFHKNIMKFCPDTRPFKDVEEMNSFLVEEINRVCRPEDVLISLGDFSFGNKDKTLEILNRIDCNIAHVYGNHDSMLRNQFGCGVDYLEFRYNKVHVVLSHYAQRVWNRSHHGSIHCYGHSHGSLPEYGRSMDVGWDAQGKILAMDEVVEYLTSKDIETLDHH